MQTVEYEGLTFSFERRRYGRGSFFCWAYVQHGEEWLLCGDPWPAVNWPRKKLLDVATYTIKDRIAEQFGEAKNAVAL